MWQDLKRLWPTLVVAFFTSMTVVNNLQFTRRHITTVLNTGAAPDLLITQLLVNLFLDSLFLLKDIHRIFYTAVQRSAQSAKTVFRIWCVEAAIRLLFIVGVVIVMTFRPEMLAKVEEQAKGKKLTPWQFVVFHSPIFVGLGLYQIMKRLQLQEGRQQQQQEQERIQLAQQQQQQQQQALEMARAQQYYQQTGMYPYYSPPPVPAALGQTVAPGAAVNNNNANNNNNNHQAGRPALHLLPRLVELYFELEMFATCCYVVSGPLQPGDTYFEFFLTFLILLSSAFALACLYHQSLPGSKTWLQIFYIRAAVLFAYDLWKVYNGQGPEGQEHSYAYAITGPLMNYVEWKNIGHIIEDLKKREEYALQLQQRRNQ